jgi:hypothetical protein
MRETAAGDVGSGEWGRTLSKKGGEKKKNKEMVLGKR